MRSDPDDAAPAALAPPAGWAREDDSIALSEPYLGGREAAYVAACVETGWVSSVGGFVDRFETRFADAVGAPQAVAVASGTAALHLALLASGVGPGDAVLVSDLTFIAPANAIRYIGAAPILVDCEAKRWQIDPRLVETYLRERGRREGGRLIDMRTGRRIAAILAVHILGHPADLDALTAIAERYALPLIEDASEALGATYGGRPVGGVGAIGCFSFNGNKLITTGGGGMAVARDPAVARRMRHLSRQAKTGPHEYLHDEIGFNYRMTNLQAALGCAQLERLDAHIDAKRRIAARYAAAFAAFADCAAPAETPNAESAQWLWTMAVGGDSRPLIQHLRNAKIESRPLWAPMHRNPPHADCERLGGAVADDLFRRAVSLPCSVGLSDAQQDRVIAAVAEWRR